jgi:hypothetical protein
MFQPSLAHPKPHPNTPQPRKPGHYTAMDPITNRATDRPLASTNEYIHPSVRARYRLQGPGVLDKSTYDARGLASAYKLVVDYGPHTSKLSDPEIYWKLRRSEGLAVRELPEAPLWRLERELARRDPETYEYIRRPPPTGEKKKRKAVRPLSTDAGGSRVDGLASPRSSRRRDTFSPRQTFPAEDRPARRSSVVVGGKREHGRERESGRESARLRSRSRARSMEYEGGETEIRDSMPHRREKDRAWWEGRR